MLGHRRKSSGVKHIGDGGILFGLAAGEIFFFRGPVFSVTLSGVKSDFQMSNLTDHRRAYRAEI